MVFDVSLLYSNCILYNEETAEVVGRSRELMHILLSVCTGEDPSFEGSVLNKDALVHDLIGGMDHSSDRAEDGTEKSGLVLKLRSRSNSNISKTDGQIIEEEMEICKELDKNSKNGNTKPLIERIVLTIPSAVKLSSKESMSSSDEDDDYDPSIRKSVKRLLESEDGSVSNKSSVDNESADNSDSSSGSSGNARNIKKSKNKKDLLPDLKKARVTRRSSRAVGTRSLCNNSHHSEQSSEDETADSNSDSEEVHMRSYRNSRRNFTPTAAVTSQSQSRKLADVRTQKHEEPIAASISKKSTAIEDIYDGVMWPSFNAIVAADEWELFAQPVTDDIAPGYSKEIMRPTDLSTIRYVIGYLLITVINCLHLRRQNLEAKKYRTVSQYKEEILRMFSNCEKYNKSGSDIADESRRLRSIFMQNI